MKQNPNTPHIYKLNKMKNPETKEFDFYIDEKVTIWNRLKFTIQAETLEEAKQKAIFLTAKEREEIEIYDSELLFDTMSELDLEDNDSNSTIELYSEENDELLYDNGKKDYPFNEGDDYWTIENGQVTWSCWDSVSEDLHDMNKNKIYFVSEELANFNKTLGFL
jgi:hypothetical protein